MGARVIHRKIVSGGRERVLACDARCDKAWGVNGGRPAVAFQGEAEPDDFAYLPDHEVGTAPACPGNWEGGYGKPTDAASRLNKWCSRQCERSAEADSLDAIRLPDFGRPLHNMPWLHPEAAASTSPGGTDGADHAAR